MTMPTPQPSSQSAGSAPEAVFQRKAQGTVVPPLVIRQPAPASTQVALEGMSDKELRAYFKAVDEKDDFWTIKMGGYYLLSGLLGMPILAGLALGAFIGPLSLLVGVALGFPLALGFGLSPEKWGPGKKTRTEYRRVRDFLSKREREAQGKKNKATRAQRAERKAGQDMNAIRFALMLQSLDDTQAEVTRAEAAGDLAAALAASKAMTERQQEIADVKATLGGKAVKIEAAYRQLRAAQAKNASP